MNYYDGQGFMVPKKLKVKSAKQLNGATVCVQPGTTNELNLADCFRANRMTFKPVVIEKLEEVLNAYFAGRCDVFTTDHSGLIALRATRAPSPTTTSSCPRSSPRSRSGRRCATATTAGSTSSSGRCSRMIEAEELGLIQKNIDQRPAAPTRRSSASSARAATSARCSASTTSGRCNIVKQVGNYGESFDANLKPLGFERGLNRLWNQGGLLYAPPMR